MSTEPTSPDNNEFDGTKPAETMDHTQASADQLAPDAPGRRAPLFGTIFWGIVLLVFAVVTVVLSISTITVDPVALTITALVVLGALLVVAGIAASVRNHRN